MSKPPTATFLRNDEGHRSMQEYVRNVERQGGTAGIVLSGDYILVYVKGPRHYA